MNEDSTVPTKRLTITLQGKEGAIGIRKNVYRALGSPRFICLRVSYKQNSLLLRACESKDLMSFEAPDGFAENHHINFRMHSLRFVQDMLISNKLDGDCTYVLEGDYSKKHNAIIVPISSAVLLNDENNSED